MVITRTFMPIINRGRQYKRKVVQQRRNSTLIQQSEPFFASSLQWLFDCDEAWVAQTFLDYQNCPEAWRLLSGLQSRDKQTDGFAKSLDVAEGFAMWALVAWAQPKVVVELGVQHGISSRLWKEALKKYVPNHQLILCDLEDKRQFIDDSECLFFMGDAYQTMPEIFEKYSVDLLHNDAHPYSLIDWSVQEGLQHNVKTFTFHDVNSTPPRNTFKPNGIALSHAEKLQNDVNWGVYGHWERHVMAEQFDERIYTENSVESEQFKTHIFESLFGFGVTLNRGTA